MGVEGGRGFAYNGLGCICSVWLSGVVAYPVRRV